MSPCEWGEKPSADRGCEANAAMQGKYGRAESKRRAMGGATGLWKRGRKERGKRVQVLGVGLGLVWRVGFFGWLVHWERCPWDRDAFVRCSLVVRTFLQRVGFSSHHVLSFSSKTPLN